MLWGWTGHIPKPPPPTHTHKEADFHDCRKCGRSGPSGGFLQHLFLLHFRERHTHQALGQSCALGSSSALLPTVGTRCLPRRPAHSFPLIGNTCRGYVSKTVCLKWPSPQHMMNHTYVSKCMHEYIWQSDEIKILILRQVKENFNMQFFSLPSSLPSTVHHVSVLCIDQASPSAEIPVYP